MLAPYLARIVWRLRNRHTPETQPPPLSPGAAALAIGYLCYVANFALVGFGLWIVASVLVPGTAISPILLTGAFASTLLIGFVTPRAPAGFGLRRVVLSLRIRWSIPTPPDLFIVLALSIATPPGT